MNMQTNPFPAILLAGPPHSGKSVLSYLLTEHLRQMKKPHYLLRAVPDGEGDWYLNGDQSLVRSLRLDHKRGFSAAFVAHMRKVIEQRQVPLLVDIGGRPQGDQFGLIEACSHSILLYHETADCAEWQGHLARAGLQPVAELRSMQKADDRILETRPVLTGIISGLERELEGRRAGVAFGALLDRVAGICDYEETALERLHLKGAPYPALVERELAARLGMPLEHKLFWLPEALPALAGRITPGEAHALYGRGPVWLAAMLAAHSLPAPFAVFDIRFGWVDAPQVRTHPRGSLKVDYSAAETGGLWARVALSDQGILETGRFSIAAPPASEGLILSGKLPRWTFAALARFFAKTQRWVAVDDPNYNRAIVVFSKSDAMPLGAVLPRANREAVIV
jgi:CRISPR-associated protein Csx3